MYFALMSYWTNWVDTFNVKINAVVLSPTCFSISCLPVVKTILFSLVRLGLSTSGTFSRINLREKKKPGRYVAARVLTVNCRCDNLNKLTLWGTRGVCMSFFQRIKHQYLKFSVAVHSSLTHILGLVLWWSVAMVTRYDVTSSSWSSKFWVKIHVFSTSFNNNSKSCG